MFSPAQLITIATFLLAPAFAQVEPTIEEVPASDLNVDSLQAVIDGQVVTGQTALQELQLASNETVPLNNTAPLSPNGTALVTNETAPAENTTTLFTDEPAEEELPLLKRGLFRRGDRKDDGLYKQLRKHKDYKFCTQYLGYGKPRTIWHTKTSIKYKKPQKYHTKTFWKTVRGRVKTKNVTKTKYKTIKGEKKIKTITDRKKAYTTKVYVTETVTGLVDATSTAWPRALHKRGNRRYSLPAYLKKAHPKSISKGCGALATQRVTFKTKTVYQTKYLGGKRYKTITKTKWIKPKSTEYKVHWTVITKHAKPVYVKTITVPHHKASTVTKEATKTLSTKICATRLARVDAAGSNAQGAELDTVRVEDEGDCCSACYKTKGCQGWFFQDKEEKPVCAILTGVPGGDKTDYCPAGTGSLTVFSRKGGEDDAAGPGQCGGPVRVVRW